MWLLGGFRFKDCWTEDISVLFLTGHPSPSGQAHGMTQGERKCQQREVIVFYNLILQVTYWLCLISLAIWAPFKGRLMTKERVDEYQEMGMTGSHFTLPVSPQILCKLERTCLWTLPGQKERIEYAEIKHDGIPGRGGRWQMFRCVRVSDGPGLEVTP